MRDAELLSAAAPQRARCATRPWNDAQPADTLLIGLGNLILGDEGVGVHAMRRLEAEYAFEPALKLELVDGGTSGLDLLPLLHGRQRLLLIDALAADAPAGSIRVLRDAEIRSALTEKVSLHHLGIADLLALAELLGDAPPETVLIGVVPERMDMALGLSARLRGRLPEVIDTARAVLGDWGIDSRPVAPSAAPAAA